LTAIASSVDRSKSLAIGSANRPADSVDRFLSHSVSPKSTAASMHDVSAAKFDSTGLARKRENDDTLLELNFGGHDTHRNGLW
jgi:hypothetical protein